MGILKSHIAALSCSTACVMFWYMVSFGAEPSLSYASLTPYSAASLVTENFGSTEWTLLYDCIFSHSDTGVDKRLSSSIYQKQQRKTRNLLNEIG